MDTSSPSFAYHAPHPALGALVAFHYVLDVGAQPFDERLCALLGQVHVCRHGVAEYELASGWSAASRVAYVGPTDQAMRLRTSPGCVIVGSGLTPAGWSSLFPTGPGLANAIAPVIADTGGLTDAVDAKTTMRALDTWLIEQLAVNRPDARIAAIDRWIVEGPAADVDGLAQELGLSRRGLERLTRRTHGATPKRLSAKYRSLKIAAELAVGTARDWREVGVASGLSDQSHFIREFTRYVGMTPGAFTADRKSFVHRLIAGRWEPGREMSIALWA